MLNVTHVKKSFGKTQVLKDISLSVEDGSKALLLGSNGAGKTTLIRCVMGLLNYEGNILVDGLEVRRFGVKVREKIGYVPQSFDFFGKLTVKEEAELVARLKHCSRDLIQENLKLMDLWDVKKRRVSALSQGMRQRFAIALALLADPALLVFDEPLSSVDLKGKAEFGRLVEQISKMGKALLIATHLPGLSELVDQAIVLSAGEVIASGSPKVLLQRINSKDRLYLKVSSASARKAVDILKELNHDFKMEGEWLSMSVDSSSKMTVIDGLSHGGCEIQDIIVEPSTIESQYLNLLGTAKS